eukprot:4505218-Pleurochrysis_carterae.AAC.1
MCALVHMRFIRVSERAYLRAISSVRRGPRPDGFARPSAAGAAGGPEVRGVAGERRPPPAAQLLPGLPRQAGRRRGQGALRRPVRRRHLHDRVHRRRRRPLIAPRKGARPGDAAAD